MLDVLAGFAVVALVVLAGVAAGRTGVLGVGAEVVLSRTVFFVCTPALVVRTIAGSDLALLLGPQFAVAAVSTLVVVAVVVVGGRLLGQRSWAETTVTALTSSMVNSVNLGVPVAVYVLGSATWVVPVLLLQVAIMTPLVVLALDTATAHESGVRQVLRGLLSNPITLACGVGALLAASPVALPRVVDDPLGLLAGAAVPLALLAFGMSLAQSPWPGSDADRRLVGLGVAAKTVVHPLAAFGVGRALGFADDVVLGTTVVAALPSAQNALVFATRYSTAVGLSRDVVLLSTFLCLPVVLAVRLLLG